MQTKNYTVSLDIGTNSVGWAVLNQDFTLAKGNKRITSTIGGNSRTRTNLWGVRLFDEADTAETARSKRGMRRRIERRKKRLKYLREIFEPYMGFDPSFFIRMEESFFQKDDTDNKTIDTSYPLFQGTTGEGESFVNEKDYYKTYPTIYHLRQRLIQDCTQADIRLVYLALHHILKFRGHFVNQGQVFNLENINVTTSLEELLTTYNNLQGEEFAFSYESQYLTQANTILTNRNTSKSKKAYDMASLYSVADKDEYYDRYEGTVSKTKKWLEDKDKQQKALFTAIVGNGIDISKIFANEDYNNKNNDEMPKHDDFKYSREDFEDKLAKLEALITPTEYEILALGKKVYEAIVLCNILTASTLSASMVQKFCNHKVQLSQLKAIAKNISNNMWHKIFKKDGLYTAFIEGVGNPAKVTNRDDSKKARRKKFNKVTNRDDFYKALREAFNIDTSKIRNKDDMDAFHNSVLEQLQSKATIDPQHHLALAQMAVDMELETYLPKQRMSDNGAIPYQVHEYELKKIIENQKQYYPFLGEVVQVEEEDDEGKKSYKEEYKIQTLMKFRIPYYVGPLTHATHGKEGERKTDKSRFAWMQKKPGMESINITPWNFNQVVDKERSASEFIERMTSFCTYLPHEKVLPDNSLTYQEFKIYNELIISGWKDNKGKKHYFTPEMRAKIIDCLFKKHKKVTAEKMTEFLDSYGYAHIKPHDLFGIDVVAKSPSYNTSYSTYIDLMRCEISEQTIEEHRREFEQIIKWITIFEDKKILKKTIIQANQNEWDNFLTPPQIKELTRLRYTGWGRMSAKFLTGICHSNGKTILQNLKEENYNNLMRLIEDDKIKEAIQEAEVEGRDVKALEYGLVEDLAGSPALKKGIWQSLKIIQELEEYLGRENISKVVIEMARSEGGSRTKTRKRQLEELYARFTEKTDGESIQREVQVNLDETDQNVIQKSERHFLYFLQNGKCMYSGKSLDISDLSSYEVDHIIPQTYIKDDSFDNKVLVLRTENQNKGGDVPSQEIIRKMKWMWELLAKAGMVSQRKLANLKLGKISDEQKEGFINRQLVETRQITKHVANILTSHFAETGIEVLTPKAGLTNQLREGVLYIPTSEFDFKNEIDKGTHFEYDGREYLPGGGGEFIESSYNNSNLVKVHFHEGYKKNRNINDYHHAHDAYLNGIVANYIYHTRPDLKNMWVYGRYQRKAERETGRTASQRNAYFKQLLTSMAYPQWELLYDDEYIHLDRDQTFAMIRKTLGYRNVNITKKIEMQLGKFGDESVYRKGDANAVPAKRNQDPTRYGGTKGAISAFTVVIRNKKGEIKPVSIPAMLANDYKKTSDKLDMVKRLYPKDGVQEIVLPVVPKHTKYILPNGAPRLLASFQEAQSGSQMPTMSIATETSTPEEMLESYDVLAEFIAKNKLFTESKISLLTTTMREYFLTMDRTVDEKMAVIKEMQRVTKGSNQGLKALQKAGLGTTAQQLKSGNAIEVNTTLIHQSLTGLYETRITLQ